MAWDRRAAFSEIKTTQKGRVGHAAEHRSTEYTAFSSRFAAMLFFQCQSSTPDELSCFREVTEFISVNCYSMY